jgi:hypothetical protein
MARSPVLRTIEDGGESFRQALSGLPPVTAVSVAYA